MDRLGPCSVEFKPLPTGVAGSNGDSGWWGVCQPGKGACDSQLQIGTDVTCEATTSAATAAATTTAPATTSAAAATTTTAAAAAAVALATMMA